jgi:hypothetical protein
LSREPAPQQVQPVISALDHCWMGFHFYEIKVVRNPVQPGVGQAARNRIQFHVGQGPRFIFRNLVHDVLS